jgi:hypothetical protein
MENNSTKPVISVNENLEKLHVKINGLEEIRELILKEINGAGSDMRKKMFFTEMLKNLLEVDKTILSYLKESSAIQLKGSDSKNKEISNELLKAIVNQTSVLK